MAAVASRLAVDILQVGLHCHLADSQGGRNLFVGPALHHADDQVELPLRQPGVLGLGLELEGRNHDGNPADQVAKLIDEGRETQCDQVSLVL